MERATAKDKDGFHIVCANCRAEHNGLVPTFVLDNPTKGKNPIHLCGKCELKVDAIKARMTDNWNNNK